MIEPGEARGTFSCDLEGRIRTYDEAAERLFGYAPDEVIGRKRISLLTPGSVALGHLDHWLERASRDGAFETKTVLLGKDGRRFAADLRLTPTYEAKDGRRRQTGFRGATAALPDVAPDRVMPQTGWPTRIKTWIVITRAPFLTATLMPMLVASAWVGANLSGGAFPWGLLASALIGAASLHIAANTFNDYFDWRSGTDPANNDYLAPYTGGSRAIELGLIGERKLLRLAIIALLFAVPAALPVLLARGPLLLGFGLAGAALAYFYTAPPLRLSARRGLGELSVMLAFGPLLTAGTVFALTGAVAADAFLIGLPLGFFAGAILWVNEFPDAEADAMTGKRHLMTTVGKRAARWAYLLWLAAAFATAALLVWAGAFPIGALAMLLALPLAARAIHIVFKHYRDRELVAACKATIQLHALCGLLLAAGLVY